MIISYVILMDGQVTIICHSQQVYESSDDEDSAVDSDVPITPVAKKRTEAKVVTLISPMPTRPKTRADDTGVRIQQHDASRHKWSAKEKRCWEAANTPVVWKWMPHSDPKGPVPPAIAPVEYFPSEYESKSTEPAAKFAIKGIDHWYKHYNYLDWLFLFFPLSVLRKITVSTNQRGIALAANPEKKTKFIWKRELTLNEMVRWLSLLFMMNFMHLGRRRMYWSTETCGAYTGPGYGKLSGIGVHRWEAILRVISYGPGPFAKKGEDNYLWDRIGELVM
jgi:hypothetical protein